jgi:hypothetical protein
MSKRLWLIVLMSVAVLMVALTVSLVSLDSARSRRQVQRLPDGSRLRLEAVTYGKEHRIALGSWWQKAIFPFLPASLKDQYPPPKWLDYPRLGHYSERPDALVLWTCLSEGKLDRVRGGTGLSGSDCPCAPIKGE